MRFSLPLRGKGTVTCQQSATLGRRARAEKLKVCDKVFKDTLLVTKLDRLARSTSDLYPVVSQLAEKDVQFKVLDDPAIDTSSRAARKLVMGILTLIAEFENDIRRERQMDGIRKARERGTRFGRKPLLVSRDDQASEEAEEGLQDGARDHASNGPQQGKRVLGTWSGRSISGELGPVMSHERY
jgi:DNA invertase Pin-like site-specific DNA recombinase